MVIRRQTIATALAALTILTTLRVTAVDAAGLDARVSRQTIGNGEAFQLRLRTSGGNAAAAPNLSPLELDFDILSSGHSVRTAIINGARQDSVTWIVTLAPKRTGRLEIPALRTGAVTSDPIAIEVADGRPTANQSGARTAGTDGGQPTVFVEAELDDDAPYVQGEARLMVRVHSTHPIVNGAITEPVTDALQVTRVGEDSIYTKEVDGRSYQVIEREYSLLPQRSGEIVIPGLVFDGSIDVDDHRRSRRADDLSGDSMLSGSMFDGFFGSSGFGPSLFEEMLGRRGRPVRARSPEIALDVKAKPAEASGHWWLPARHVELEERWDPEPEDLVVGDQATRTIILRAIGAADQQLPQITPPPVEGLKQYTEPGAQRTVEADGNIIALKSVQTVVIPTRAGTVTLPELRLDWWDSDTDEQRAATLPARTIEIADPSALGANFDAPVAPAASTQSTPASTESVAATTSADSTDPARTPRATDVVLPATKEEGPARWPRISTPLAWSMAGGILFVAGAVAVTNRRRSQARPATALHPTQQPAAGRPVAASRVRRLERELRAACRAGDAPRARNLLVELGSARRPGSRPSSLHPLGDRPSGRTLTCAIDALNRSCYADGSSASVLEDARREARWDGTELWEAYRRAARRAMKKDRGAPQPHAPLPELYPVP